METVIFDTETTGLIKPEAQSIDEQPEIIEIYCVKLDDDFNIIGEFDQLLKPQKPISETITRITGIDAKMVAGKPSFAEIAPDLCKFFVGTQRVVAHNLAFDRNMLANELLRVDRLLKFPWPPEHICTVQKSMGIEQRRINLSKLHEYACGKPLANAHRAKDDVFGLVRCYHWMVERGMV